MLKLTPAKKEALKRLRAFYNQVSQILLAN